MARIRSLKPEFWSDEELAADLSRDARLLYAGLWNLSDEHGRLRGDPRYVKGQLFPYDDDLSPAAVDGLLGELASARKVMRYRVHGRSYLFLPNLAKHQRLEAEKVPSRLPSPDEAEPDPDGSARGTDESAWRTDEPAPNHGSDGENTASPAATVRTDKSARGTDESALLYVAGVMDQGSCITSAKPPRDESSGREDVERICVHLADRIEGNGSKRPTITKRWRDAVRLMLDNDGRTEADVHAAIDWSQNDEFWRGNVLSAPKLRDKYDQLRLQAGRSSPNGRRPSTTDQRVAEIQALKSVPDYRPSIRGEIA